MSMYSGLTYELTDARTDRQPHRTRNNHPGELTAICLWRTIS